MAQKTLLFLLALGAVTGVGLVLWGQWECWVADGLQGKAQELAAVNSEPENKLSPKTESAEGAEVRGDNPRFLAEVNLTALQQINPDVLGWIYIPDSPVNYPLLKVQDNNEYLRRAWDGTPNCAGCIFLECRNSCDFSDFNTLIYGHYMQNRTMFGSLHEYKEQEYRETHPYIYIVTDNGVRCYEVFAAYEADVVSDTYRLFFEDNRKKQFALDGYQNNSVLKTACIPTVEDYILT